MLFVSQVPGEKRVQYITNCAVCYFTCCMFTNAHPHVSVLLYTEHSSLSFTLVI